MLFEIVAMIRASDGAGVIVRGGWAWRGPGRPAKFGNRAPRRVRSQAIAQNHQGPQDGMAAGLGTTTARGLNLSGSILGNDQKNSDYRARS